MSFSSTPTTLEVVDNSFTVLTPQYNDGYFSVSGTGSGTSHSMYMDSIVGLPGSLVSVPVGVTGFDDIISFQGSIVYDPAVLSYSSISGFNLPGLSISSFGLTQTGLGIITYSWYDASLQGESLVDSSSLFTLEFFVLGSTGQGSSLSFSSTPTTLEVVDNSFTTLIPQYNDGYFSVDGSGGGTSHSMYTVSYTHLPLPTTPYV